MAAEDLAEQGAMKELHTTYGKVRFPLSLSAPSPSSPYCQPHLGVEEDGALGMCSRLQN
jgi:hypothetical protein